MTAAILIGCVTPPPAETPSEEPEWTPSAEVHEEHDRFQGNTSMVYEYAFEEGATLRIQRTVEDENPENIVYGAAFVFSGSEWRVPVQGLQTHFLIDDQRYAPETVTRTGQKLGDRLVIFAPDADLMLAFSSARTFEFRLGDYEGMLDANALEVLNEFVREHFPELTADDDGTEREDESASATAG